MKSILFSFIQHFLKLSPSHAISDTYSALLGMVRALTVHSGDAKVIGALRTLHCAKCVFYDSKWKTCGTPGDTMGEPLGVQLKVGCWCYLPLANRDPKKDCYARAYEIVGDNGESVGWPDVLRPH